MEKAKYSLKQILNIELIFVFYGQQKGAKYISGSKMTRKEMCNFMVFISQNNCEKTNL